MRDRQDCECRLLRRIIGPAVRRQMDVDLVRPGSRPDIDGLDFDVYLNAVRLIHPPDPLPGRNAKPRRLAVDGVALRRGRFLNNVLV